jgi:hypothetical protein
LTKGHSKIIQNGGDIAVGITYVFYFFLYNSGCSERLHFGKFRQNAIEIYLFEFAISHDGGRIQNG